MKLYVLQSLTTPTPGKMATRLPTRFAKTNAALIAWLTKAGKL